MHSTNMKIVLISLERPLPKLEVTVAHNRKHNTSPSFIEAAFH